MANLAAAFRRPRRPRAPAHPSAGVADPRRGTTVALLYPVIAFTLVALWPAPGDAGPRVSAWLLAVVVIAAMFAERVSVQLGPRSWYTASTPTIILAGLLGGPVAGVVAGIAGPATTPGSVWRRRCADGGLGAIQGWSAGLVGAVALDGADGAVALTAIAFTAAVMLNTAGRLGIMLARRIGDVRATLTRGLEVDLVEGAIMTPLIAILVHTAPASETLAAAALGGGVAMLTVAHRLRLTTIEALLAEQAAARRDPLTGAPNRRAFEEALEAEHARIVRGGVPAGLFVVDVDRFKQINDRFGHAVGDAALVAVVQRLSAGLRPSDVVARWGGEEITVLAPGMSSLPAVERFAERIRRLVCESPLAAGGAAVEMTVSVGGTLLDGSVEPTSALRYADTALYEAKQARNASAVHGPTPRQVARRAG